MLRIEAKGISLQDRSEKKGNLFERLCEELINIKKEDKYSEFWNMIWEIYVRIENYTRNKRLAKYLLSRNGGIDVQAMPMGI